MNMLGVKKFIEEELEVRINSYLPEPDDFQQKELDECLAALNCVERQLGYPLSKIDVREKKICMYGWGRGL